MKLVSFNVNGIRAILAKNFEEDFKELDADIFLIGESKFSEDVHASFPFMPSGYQTIWTVSKERKGYSGVTVFTRVKPLNIHYGLKDGKYDNEGRVITLEFDNFFYVGAYVPNAGEGLKRLDFRLGYEKDLREYLVKLDKIKPVVYTGDLNVAHKEIDIKNPKGNEHNPGFTKEERDSFTELLDLGFVDTFRELHKDEVKYSWWSYRFHAREKNAGWRIDYFVVSKRIFDKVKSSEIHNEIYGSDHCPISLEIDL
ncbi:exodeoxyribonuclease-like [Opisthocomus hoazin]|uniref:exodeoxyribonuclease-like n=1 Tax=Opisthocomus hoazin TaxID=30419 RepID=UPI003F53AAD2